MNNKSGIALPLKHTKPMDAVLMWRFNGIAKVNFFVRPLFWRCDYEASSGVFPYVATVKTDFIANDNLSSGTRRRLTWVRPPLDEKGMELTALRRSASDGDGDWFKSRREISSPSPKSRLHSWKHFTTRLFRKRANTFPVAPGLNTGKISNKRKERKLWNMIHIMSGGQNFKCPEWIFQGTVLTQMTPKVGHVLLKWLIVE